MATRGKVNKSATRDTEDRTIKWRKYPHLFLIVCEDESTEPYYFGKFKEEFEKIYPNDTVFLHPVGIGRNSKGVVEQAIIQKQNLYKESGKTIDEVWAVFDKDDLDKSKGNAQRFKEAFEIGAKENVQIAYSNEAFELWLLLHFVDVNSNTPISRRDIYSFLETIINKGRTSSTQFAYNHGDTQIVDIILKSGSESDAITRAQNLDNIHTKTGTEPINANPNTKVYLLVSRLRDLLKWYSNTL
ncbi:hypothetical protein AGMMS4956_10700 [Bacteroidia bacterium]|nr:hypothetical protein AGMMS4956_10700 [Bacteroidia bacterium]